jgi:tRNA 2-thiocytidine biosynthesis protein TtcA
MGPVMVMDIERRLLRDVGRAVGDHRLIESGDRILVAMSGGKDSYAMCVLLRDLQARAPVRFDLLAVHLDQGQPGYDGAPLAAWLEAEGVPHKLLHENTYAIVTDKIPEGKTYCSLCSRLRRGILYSAAADLGCNKIALGHHADDLLETLLMSQFYNGEICSMPPILKARDGRNIVIRPLCYVWEEEIIRFTGEAGFPVICCACPACGDNSLKRKQMKLLLQRLEADHSGIKASLLRALSNLRTEHLLDRRFLPALGGKSIDLDPGQEKRDGGSALGSTVPTRAGSPTCQREGA